jgi:hypothetical protein
MTSEPCPGCEPTNCSCAAAKVAAKKDPNDLVALAKKYKEDTDKLVALYLTEKAKVRELEQRLVDALGLK